MSSQPQRTLRVDPATIGSWLDRLDRQTRSPAGVDLRVAQRYEYQGDALTLEFPVDDETAVCHTVAPRNLSRQGIGLLAGQFVYPRTPCRVTLRSPFLRAEVVPGTVKRCRYLLGSGSLHEVGVEFDHPIDVAVFAPHARLVSVLLVALPGPIPQLVQSFLSSSNTELTCATSPYETLRKAAARDFALVLIDLDGLGIDPFGLIRRLRDDGHIGPVVGLSVQTNDQLHHACVASGCTGYISKPITRDGLNGLMASLVEKPLISTQAQDADLAPLIDRFVAGLRERMIQLSRACQTCDRDALARLARALRAEAGSYGFEVITQTAAYLQALVTAGASFRRVRRAVHHLVHLSLRARPATPDSQAIVSAVLPDNAWTQLLPEFGVLESTS